MARGADGAAAAGGPGGGPLLLRLGEVAGLLGLSERTVADLVARRELRSVKVGRARRVARADVEAYVEALRQDALTWPRAQPSLALLREASLADRRATRARQAAERVARQAAR